MGFLVNDCSLHGQFHTAAAFRESLDEVMRIRAAVQRHGHALYCHRKVSTAKLGPSLTMQQAVGALPRDLQRAVLGWLTQHGPFWDDEPLHGSDDCLYCNDDDIVTDTAMGEAAFAWLSQGAVWRLISFSPSTFEVSPIAVRWQRGDDAPLLAEVENHWSLRTVEACIAACPVPLASWRALEEAARLRFDRLVIARDAFSSLGRLPFSPGVADRVMVILDILDRLRGCFDGDGKRTAAGHELYQSFFTGKKSEGGRGALFSTSSETEQEAFRDVLTFPHPEGGEALFCPWHGKIQTPPLRVHFSSPISVDRPLYVVYIGWKLTTR